jgi:hypothetical protein
LRRERPFVFTPQHGQHERIATKLKIRAAAWYPKAIPTFGDAIAAVRREIWAHQISFMSRPHRDRIEIPLLIWQRLQNALAYAPWIGQTQAKSNFKY